MPVAYRNLQHRAVTQPGLGTYIGLVEHLMRLCGVVVVSASAEPLCAGYPQLRCPSPRIWYLRANHEWHAMTRTTTQVLVAALAGLAGLSLSCGGIGELVGVLLYDRLPAEVQEPLRQLHASLVVKGLVLIVGVGSLSIGLMMLSSVRGVRLGTSAAVVRLRWAAWLLVGLIVGSQLVLSATLFPMLLTSAPAEPFPGFWLTTMIGSAIGPIVLGGVIVSLCGRLLVGSSK